MSQERCEKCGRAFKKDRSHPQNSYYWAVVVSMISEETGYGKEETHEILKAKFLREPRIIEVKGKIQEVDLIKSTTGLTTVEYEEFLSQVRQWASETLNCYIPLPNEATEE